MNFYSRKCDLVNQFMGGTPPNKSYTETNPQACNQEPATSLFDGGGVISRRSVDSCSFELGNVYFGVNKAPARFVDSPFESGSCSLQDSRSGNGHGCFRGLYWLTKPRRVKFPLFEITSNPEIALTSIKSRRFHL